MNNSYITIIKEKRTVLSRKRVPLNQNECTADFRIGVPFEQNLQVRHMMLSARTQIAVDIINENYDCARSYLYGYKIPGFMTGISGMGYSLLRDLYPELPCILALEI